MYKILIERRAEKDLNALDHLIKERVIKRILILGNNPRPTNCKKLIGSENDWRVRIGDWRIIYEVNDKLKEVKIYSIKHRSMAY